MPCSLFDLLQGVIWFNAGLQVILVSITQHHLFFAIMSAFYMQVWCNVSANLGVKERKWKRECVCFSFFFFFLQHSEGYRKWNGDIESHSILLDTYLIRASPTPDCLSFFWEFAQASLELTWTVNYLTNAFSIAFFSVVRYQTIKSVCFSFLVSFFILSFP